MKYLIPIAAIVLTGCATQPEGPTQYADCLIPTTETSSLGAQVLGCQYYFFGPSVAQRVKHKYHLFNYWGQ